MISDRFYNDERPEVRLNLVQRCALYKFQEELDHNQYRFETYSCECGTEYEKLITLSQKDRYGLEVITKICPVCGLVMTNPRMNQESYKRFYDFYYRQIYVGRRRAGEEYFERQKKHGKEIYRYIKQNYDIAKIHTVLEIGCGAGGILSVFREQGIEKCKGVDLGSEYIQFGRQRGLDLENCSSEQLQTSGGYDLIILSHVLEHFLDIQKELDVIRKLLSEDGILYVEVPGINNLGEVYGNDFLVYLQNAHVRHFSCDTLTQILAWNGFTRLCGNENVQSLFIKGECETEIVNYKDTILDAITESEKIFSNQHKAKAWPNEADKIFDIMTLLDAWMNVNRSHKKVVDYLMERFVKKVAIYGMGVLGRQLYAELEVSDIEIDFVIDRKEVQNVRVPVYKPEDNFPAVDMIIMTTVGEFTAIRRTINRRGTSVVPLAEVILTLSETER